MTKQQFKRMRDIRWKMASGIKLTKREREFHTAHQKEYVESDYRYSETDKLQMIDFDILRAIFEVPEYIGMKEFMYEFNQRLLRRKNEERLMKKDLKLAPVYNANDDKRSMHKYIFNNLVFDIIRDIKHKQEYGE